MIAIKLNKVVIIIALISTYMISCSDNENSSKQEQTQRIIQLFDTEGNYPSKFQFQNVELIIKDVSLEKSDSILFSNFSLIYNSDTVYQLGLVYSDYYGIGYLGRCEQSTRYYFKDTTFQHPLQNEFCANLFITDVGRGVWFDAVDTSENNLIIPIYSESENFKNEIIYLTLDNNLNLIKINW